MIVEDKLCLIVQKQCIKQFQTVQNKKVTIIELRKVYITTLDQVIVFSNHQPQRKGV